MPIYVYECSNCSHEFEEIQKLGEGSEDVKCPKCNAGNPKKLVTPFKAHFWSTFIDDIEKQVNPQKFKSNIPKATPELIKDIASEVSRKRKKAGTLK